MAEAAPNKAQEFAENAVRTPAKKRKRQAEKEGGDEDMPEEGEDVDISGGMTVGDFYRRLVGLMYFVFNGFVDLNCDWNCEVAAMQILAVLGTKNPQYPATLTFMKNGAMAYKQKFPDEVKERLAHIKGLLNEDTSKQMFPHVAIMQKFLKTKDEILYSKSSVTQDLGLPGYLEAFASGKLVKDNLKKSRPRQIGVLCHIRALRMLHEAPQKAKPGKVALTPELKRTIIKDKKKVLKSLVIGQCQKIMMNEFIEGDFSNLLLFGLTLPFIKPRQEHCYVVHPEILMKLTNEEMTKASYTNAFAFEAYKKYSLNHAHPPSFTHGKELLFHMFLGSAFEDLDVLDWFTGETFHERQEWGTFNKGEANWKITPMQLTTKYWCRPQKGAPRSSGIAGAGQICTVPSLRGRRRTFNPNVSLEDLFKQVAPTQNTLFQQAEQEIEVFKAHQYEGTGDFYLAEDVAEKNPVDCPVGGKGRMFFGNMKVQNPERMIV